MARGKAFVFARVVGSLILLVLPACVEQGRPDRRAVQSARSSSDARPSSSPTVALSDGLLLSSSFERPICGFWWRPKAGCEFGVEGVDTSTGAWTARTGRQSARMERMSPEHMGVIRAVPLPAGHGFIGVAHRIPAFPDEAIPDGRWLQLEQLSPTDGVLAGWPVEVRIFPDRRLGLALFREKTSAKTDWAVPVDAWFYVVVELTNGVKAPQRLWVYDEDDTLVDTVEVRLTTRQVWAHATRTAQKVGGSASTTVPLYTYHDDWYVSTTFRGPMHVGPTGLPLSGRTF